MRDCPRAGSELTKIAGASYYEERLLLLLIRLLEETVTVAGASEIIQTQATAVAATLTRAQIANLPVVGRGAFELVGFVPGVQTTTGSLRDGTINGLPQSSVNITLDGMNIQDNYAKSWDGMFTRVSPRLDAVEEVTVLTAAQGRTWAARGRRRSGSSPARGRTRIKAARTSTTAATG